MTMTPSHSRKTEKISVALVLILMPMTLGAPAQAADSSAVAATPAPREYRPQRFPRRAELRYSLVWGVDSLSVKWAESGELIRFNWRVLDPAKATAISDRKAEPQLLDPEAGVSLVVPALEKVGKLRQTSTPVAGKSYWMAFSNKGRSVKKGDHVSVVIGKFRAEGLVVE